jgi:hypothetical protein
LTRGRHRDEDDDVIAAVFEAKLTREQAEQLAELMREGHATRPAAVISTALTHDGEYAQLIAFWPDRESYDAYVASVPAPRGVEFMRKVGAEPTVRVVDTLQLG